MDIIVRNIDPVICKKLNELAKAKGVSRIEYLKQLIESHAGIAIANEVTSNYEKIIQKLMIVISDNTETMEQLKEIIENTGGQKNG